MRTPVGDLEHLTARAVISAVGQLNRPNLPDIPGRDDFTGPWFHSAQWDHSVDHRGQRVALVGAGASGFQIAPTIAPDVDRLTVFQRTPQWMFPNPNYHAKVGPGVQWALRHLPFYGRWYRFLILWSACDKGLEGARVDPDWPDQERSVSEGNELTRQIFTDWITSQIGDDAELRAKVVPDYPPTAKRTLQDNGSWLGALTRDNVELVNTGIDHIEADAIVTDRRDSATRSTSSCTPPASRPTGSCGRWRSPDAADGRSGEAWGERAHGLPRHHRPRLPQPVLHVRPGHQPGPRRAASSSTPSARCGTSPAASTPSSSGTTRRWSPARTCTTPTTSGSRRSSRAWCGPSPTVQHSWFKNPEGQIYILSPWRLVDYWGWTKDPDLDDFVLT